MISKSINAHQYMKVHYTHTHTHTHRIQTTCFGHSYGHLHRSALFLPRILASISCLRQLRIIEFPIIRSRAMSNQTFKQTNLQRSVSRTSLTMATQVAEACRRHIVCTAYRVYGILCVRHTVCTAYCVYGILCVRHTVCKAYFHTLMCILLVLIYLYTVCTVCSYSRRNMQCGTNWYSCLYACHKVIWGDRVIAPYNP